MPSYSDAAVIDVGSNSVRLVLYRLDGRAIWSVFNEKILAGLGRDLRRTGRLNAGGVEASLRALRRFRALIDASRPGRVFAAATAAVREAADGEAFRRRVQAETGFDLRVLSGEEEARYAALGVMAGAPESRGLVGDLGGASLELTRLGAQGPRRGVTLPLGPFAMDVQGRFDAAATHQAAHRLLQPIERTFRSETFHAVGGAWRSLALVQMRLSDYPLEIIHQYEFGRREALDASRFISQQSRSSLERIEGLSKRRMETLPHAAVLLECLIERLGLQKVIMSAYGLREGLVWEALAPELRGLDPLAAGCAALGGRPDMAEPLGRALDAWLSPGFGRLDPAMAREPALIAAACRLADLGAQLHPDHRADLVFNQVLRAPIAGMAHDERAFLACVAFSRHTASAVAPDTAITERLLGPEQRLRARALGAALRLGCDLSGRSPDLLARTRLDIRPGIVSLQAEEAWAPVLLGEQTAKRAQTLAGLLERSLKLKTAAARPGLLASVL
jgi:exopolyphosphatase / guanosine-5'-triphosphate,3'-diphosphate pyrophosphatase